MKEITSILLVLVTIYLLAGAFLYLYQRKLIYFPVPVDPTFKADELGIESQGVRLHGWVLNPGKVKAIIYFGGNSELVTHRAAFFRDVFRDYSVYLINYRGYGNSEGSPHEAGLFADALSIYDKIASSHDSITAYGRSLGSGVAVYLAANRPLDKLILLTPYDSVAEVAQRLYPIFPVKFLIKDRFDSASRAGNIRIPVMVAMAEHDHEIKAQHSTALIERLTHASVFQMTIAGAAHNDIVDYPDYRRAVREFISD